MLFHVGILQMYEVTEGMTNSFTNILTNIYLISADISQFENAYLRIDAIIIMPHWNYGLSSPYLE